MKTLFKGFAIVALLSGITQGAESMRLEEMDLKQGPIHSTLQIEIAQDITAKLGSQSTARFRGMEGFDWTIQTVPPLSSDVSGFPDNLEEAKDDFYNGGGWFTLPGETELKYFTTYYQHEYNTKTSSISISAVDPATYDPHRRA